MDFGVFMSGGGWVLFSLIAAAFTAGFYLINQYYRQPGLAIVFWMRVMTVAVMTPWMLHIDWPARPGFYIVVFFTAMFGVYGDVRTFDVSARYGGGVVSRVMPMTVWASFFLWFVFRPDLIANYLAHPWNTAGILLALAGCVYFAGRLKKCDITHAALKTMFPALVAYSFSLTLNKKAMDYGAAEASFAGVVYTYMYVQSIFAALMLTPLEYRRLRIAGVSLRPHQPLLAAAALAALAWIGHMVHKNYAMAFTSNPSYQGAIGLTSPVFISLFYWVKKHKEEADVSAGFGVVACAMLLALAHCALIKKARDHARALRKL